MNRALQFFNARFTYTLEPPLLASDDPYDEFLFETKRGFCEHYAGSFALLMRAAGIPARVVTGYQGGEVNPLNRELLVRQADAHAWVEVWLEGRGWLRVDPTSVVAPDRIDSGINAALGPIGMIPTLIAADRLRVLANMRFAWDALNSQWNQWVLGYNVDRQRQFLASLGLEIAELAEPRALAHRAPRSLVGGARGAGSRAARPPRPPRSRRRRLGALLRQARRDGPRARPLRGAGRLPRARRSRMRPAVARRGPRDHARATSKRATAPASRKARIRELLARVRHFRPA